MAKIRFEDVSVTAKVIEVDEVQDPTALLTGLGLVGANVKGGVSHETKSLPDVEPPAEIPIEVPPAAQIEQMEKDKIAEEDLDGARRLRDVVQVFMDKGVTEINDIVSQCVKFKAGGNVPILKRMPNIEDRMPLAVEKWLASNS